MTNHDFESQVNQARLRVKELDELDGYADRYSGTIYQALLCGLQNPTTGAQFDALVMLEDLYHQQRQTRLVLTPQDNG